MRVQALDTDESKGIDSKEFTTGLRKLVLRSVLKKCLFVCLTVTAV